MAVEKNMYRRLTIKLVTKIENREALSSSMAMQMNCPLPEYARMLMIKASTGEICACCPRIPQASPRNRYPI